MTQSYDPDFYSIVIPRTGLMSPEEVRDIILDGFGDVWAASKEGNEDGVIYQGPANDYQLERYTIDTAMEYFLSDERGSLTVFDGDINLSLSRNPSIGSDPGTDISGFSLTLERVHFSLSLERSDYGVVSTVFDVASYLFRRLSAPFAFSRIPNDLEYETEVTAEHVTEPRHPDVYWLTLLSEELCEAVGRSRLESAPVWKAEPLDDGGFGLVVTDHPYDYQPEDKRRVKEHLGLDD